LDEAHARLVLRINELVKRRGMTLSHLPDRAAIARSYFWKIMDGSTSPTLGRLCRIAEALEVDVAELLRPVLRPAAVTESERPVRARRRSKPPSRS
jgi:transcriptional regulator with XRE-family HTH domain